MTVYILERLLAMSACATVLSVILLLIKPVTKKLFSARWHYITYVLALLVFLIPLSVEIPEKKAVINDGFDNTEAVFVLNNGGAEQIIAEPLNELHQTNFVEYAHVILMTWLCISFAVFSFSVVCYIVFKFKNNKCAGLCCDDMLLELGCTKLRVAVTDKVDSPMLLGFVKCSLFLPNKEYSSSDLQNILCHECVHVKRHDNIVKWLCLIVKALYFFNPVVYILCKNINEQCEVSCDISATYGFDEGKKQSYCMTILSLITRKNKDFLVSLSVGGTKKQLERRFRSIMNKKIISRKTAVISAVVTGAVILSALTVSALLAGKAELQDKPYDRQTDDAQNINAIGAADVTEENLAETNSDFSSDTQAGEKDENVLVKMYVAGDESGNVINTVLYDPNGGEIEYIEPVTVDGENVYISCGYIPDKHNGIDYAAQGGTPVKAPVSGRIITAEYNNKYGYHIIIDSGENYTALLAHLESMAVGVGDQVNSGDVIGAVGSTGMATGPHVHLEFNRK